MIFITGDTHRDFSRFESFCRKNKTTKNDLMIVLGDASLNFYGEKSDRVKNVKYLDCLSLSSLSEVIMK